MRIGDRPSSGRGRSRTVARGGLVWTVATTTEGDGDFAVQAAKCLTLLDSHLVEAGSARTHILSLQVVLADIADRPAFDELWQVWIGADPACWPQRACFEGALAPGLLVELVAVASAASASQILHSGEP